MDKDDRRNDNKLDDTSFDKTDNQGFNGWVEKYKYQSDIIKRKREKRRVAMRKKVFRNRIVIASFCLVAIVCVVIIINVKNNNDSFSVEPAASDRLVSAVDNESKADESVDKIETMSITYDFDYTTEILSGEDLNNLLNKRMDGSYSVNHDKCMEYVNYLAQKYDTCDTSRNFHATWQGDIVIPISDDAKYGWKIDRDKTCEELEKMLGTGEIVENVDPIYYDAGYGYVFEGVESARTEDDDIGNTYIEIDLSAQHLWVYKSGEMVYECDIVSGQTTSKECTTLPGVYKLWYKAQQYRMVGDNKDGDTWDTMCNYWNRVAICGVGLHDSEWRSAFGSNIYKYNGSKGCINMSLEGAKYVYDNVELETPVVMYYSQADYDVLDLES